MHGLVTDYTYHFSLGMLDLDRHSTHKMRLNVTEDRPVFHPRHRLSREEWDIIDSKVEELAKNGLIEQEGVRSFLGLSAY